MTTDAKTTADATGGTSNTDTSMNGEYRAGAGIYVNAKGEWTDPYGGVLTGEALAKAEAEASAKYGVGYRDGNLYIEAVAEAKLRAEVALKAEYQNGDHAVGTELYAYAEVYAWAGGTANAGTDGCWFEGGAIAGAKAGVGNNSYYTNEALGLAVTNDTSVSVGTQVGAKIGGGYQVPDWNKDSKPVTVGCDVNLALLVGVKTGGTVTVDVDPVYDIGEDAVGTVVDNVVAPVAPIVDKVVAPIVDAGNAVIDAGNTVIDAFTSPFKPSKDKSKKKKKWGIF